MRTFFLAMIWTAFLAVAAYGNAAETSPSTPTANSRDTIIDLNGDSAEVELNETPESPGWVTQHGAVLSGRNWLRLPLRTAHQAVGLSTSVSIVDQWRTPGANIPELHVRGGETSGSRWYVNGISFRDDFTGRMTATICPYAVDNLDFQPGAGTISLTGCRGQERISGFAEVITDNTVGTGYDQNWYTLGLNGSLPSAGWPRLLFSFVVERRYFADRSPSPLAEKINHDGSGRLRHNWQDGWSQHGRVDLRLAEKSNLYCTFDNSYDEWAEYVHRYNNPDYPEQLNHAPRTQDRNTGMGLGFSHSFTERITAGTLVSYFRSKRVRGDGVLFDNLEAYERTFANPEYDQFYLFREGTPVWSSDQDTLITPGSVDDTLVAYVPSYYASFLKHETSHLGMTGSIDVRLRERHSLRAGFDFKRHTVRYFESLNPTMGFAYTRVNYFGYDSLGQESDADDWRSEAKHPTDMALFAEGAFRGGIFAFSPSLRLDHWSSDALVLRDYARPFDPDSTEDTALDESDLTEAESQTRLSWQLAATCVPNEWVSLEARYGNRYERPAFEHYYVNWDFFEARVAAGSSFLCGNGDLKPAGIEEVEAVLAIGQANRFLLSFTGYSRRYSDLVTVKFGLAVPQAYNRRINGGESTSKGLEAAVEARLSSVLVIGGEASMSKDEYSASSGAILYSIGWQNPDGSTTLYPLSWDRRYRLAAHADVSSGKGAKLGSELLDDLDLSVVLRSYSGTKYTPKELYDEIAWPGTGHPIATLYSEEMPAYLQIDLKLQKSFTVGKLAVVPFLWIMNLLDRGNAVYVYEGTGLPDDTKYLTTTEGESKAANSNVDEHTGEVLGDRFYEHYTLAQQNPTHYATPRQVFFGVRVSF